MSEKKWVLIANISLSQLGIAIISLGAIVVTVVLEVPQIGFPKTHWFYSGLSIDYWRDIFFPATSIPRLVVLIVMGLNILGLFLAYWLYKRWHPSWTIWVATITLLSLALMWLSIIWVHGALRCIADDLKYGHIFGCDFNFQPQTMHFVVGILFSTLILIAQTLWNRRFLKSIQENE